MHLQEKIEELTKRRKESRDTFEQASLGDQIALTEELLRAYNKDVDTQLGLGGK